MSYSLTEALLIALAVVLIIEGFGPMLFTKKWQQFMLQMSLQPLNQLKTTGGVLVTIGLVSLLYLI